MSRTIKFVLLMSLILSLALSACGSSSPTAAPATQAPVATEALTNRNCRPQLPQKLQLPTRIPSSPPPPPPRSGLLDVLVPMFEEQTGYTVQTIAVGSGEAMKMGEEGNADVLLVHAPASEVTFMEGGFGTDRFLVMHNDFIIVGPADDPAKTKAWPPNEAFAAISNSGAQFITRGDDSGTHKKGTRAVEVCGTRPRWSGLVR